MHKRFSLLVILIPLVIAACGTPQQPPVTTDRSLDVTVDGTGSGTVTSEAAEIDVGAGTETFTFASGTEVTLTASAATGSTFAGWSGACTGNDPACTVTLNANQAVTATFNEIVIDPDVTEDLSVTIAAGGSAAGSVVSDPEGIDMDAVGTEVHAFPVGGNVTLTATATAGGFAGWTGGACDGLKTLTCTITITEGEAPVTANFNDVETLDVRVLDNADDAEEFLKASTANPTRWPLGYTYIRSDDLELGFDPQHAPQAVGLRFVDVDVPAGAHVLAASIGFTAFDNTLATVPGTGTTGEVVLTITAEASASSSQFVDDPNTTGANPPSFGVTSLTPTSATAIWTITEAWTAETEYSSSDVGSIVQEVIGLAGWSAGGAVKFMIEVDDIDSIEWRRGYAHNIDATKAATLSIEFVRLP